jgi:imidazolonepropionase-like amidohydrolase
MLFIKNAKIKTMAGADIENGSILVEDGKIKAIGADLPEPAGDATIIDAKGRLTTPGLIDGHSHIGLFGEATGWAGSDGNEAVDPVTPHLRALDAINPLCESFGKALAGGVTLVGTGPGSANAFGGTFTAIKLVGRRVDDMVVRQCFAMKCAFGENPKRVYGTKDKAPQTRMGIAAIIRETLAKAKRYCEELDEYEKSDKPEKKKPAFDAKLNALLPVIRREIPLKAHAHKAEDIFTALRIAKEFDVDITIEHCSEGHLIVDELVAEDIYVFVGPTFGSKTKVELKNLSFETVKVLSDAGMKVSITTDAPVIPQGSLALCAGFAVAAGMNEEKAWKAITIIPAMAMGIADRVGSLEVGKDADIVIFTGDPLRDIDGSAAITIVDGKIVYRKE